MILKNGKITIVSYTKKPPSILEVNATITGKLVVISDNNLDLNSKNVYSTINPSGNGSGTITFSTRIKYVSITTTNLDNMDLESGSGTNITKVTIQSDGVNWWMIGN